jgi:hypothetical protein
LIIVFSEFNSLQSKIDLFEFNNAQIFEHSKAKMAFKLVKPIDIDVSKKSDPIINNNTKLSTKENQMSLNKQEPQIKKLLNLLVEKYEKLKKTEKSNSQENNLEINKIQKNLIFNSIRFRQSAKHKQMRNLEKDMLNYNQPQTLQRDKNNAESPAGFGVNDVPPEINNGGNPSQGHNIPIFPLHILTRPPGLMPKSSDKNIFIDNSLIKKLKFNRQFGLQTSIKSIPIQECQIQWDYVMHGDNWSCLVLF